MSRYMRFAVCAVLGFGVIALFLSDTGESTPTKMEKIIASVDSEMSEKAVEAEPANFATPKPRLTEQALKALDNSAQEREKRSAQRMNEGPPATDSVTIRKQP